ARRGVVGEVRRVQAGLAGVLEVRPSLRLGGLDGAVAARAGVLHPGMVQQLADRAGPGVAVDGVGVHVAEDHELVVGGEPAAVAGIVHDPARAAAGAEVVGPQADLVVVAALVALLGAVEAGRGGVGGEHVDGARTDPHRHVPVRLRAQAQLGRDLRAVELRGQEVAGHVRPAQLLEGAHLVGEDRVPRQEHHPVLARELAEAPGVAGTADGAVAVEVVAAGHPGVDRRGVGVPVPDRALPVLGDLEVVVRKRSIPFPSSSWSNSLSRTMSGLLIWMISATARICGSSPTPLSGSAARSSSRSPSAARFSEALKVATRRFTTLPRGREGWGAAWAAAGRPNPAAAAAANARRRVTRGVMHPLCTFDSKGRNRSVDAGTPHPLRPAARWQTEPMRIAFLGTGRMGTELALRLIPDHDLTVWNRTAGRTARLAEAGAAVADTAAAAVEGADLVVT